MKHARTALTMQRAILLLFLIPAAPAAAVQYQISYEADTPGSFPEDEGWDRTMSVGRMPAFRAWPTFVIARALSDFGLGQIFDPSDAFGYVRQVLPGTIHGHPPTKTSCVLAELIDQVSQRPSIKPGNVATDSI